MNRIIIHRLRLLILFFVISMASAWSQNDLKIINKTVSFGMRSKKNRSIHTIVVHSTFNKLGGDKYNIDLIIKQFSHYRVSSHYVIGRDGSIFRLVKESNIAFHAGRNALLDGHITSLNSSSIGIELMTSYDEAPTDKQVHSLALLVKDIEKRYKIDHIVRHSDIAPNRKTDPWNMNWEAFLELIQDKKAIASK